MRRDDTFFGWRMILFWENIIMDYSLLFSSFSSSLILLFFIFGYLKDSNLLERSSSSVGVFFEWFEIREWFLEDEEESFLYF